MIRIIPNSVRHEINLRLDAEISRHHGAVTERESLYAQLLDHFSRTGEVPEFTLTRKPH